MPQSESTNDTCVADTKPELVVWAGAMGEGQVYSCTVSIKIKCSTFDTLCTGLLDTGSSVSIIERKVVTGRESVNDRVLMRTAGPGTGLVSESKVSQEFLLGDKLVMYEFLVVESLNLPGLSVVLGFDFIVNQQVDIVTSTSPYPRVFFQREEIPVRMNGRSLGVNVVSVENVRQVLSVVEDVCIPAETAVCVSVRAPRERMDGDWVVIDSVEKYEENVFSGTLYQVREGRINFFVYNMCPVSLTINADSPVAYAEQVSVLDIDDIVIDNNVPNHEMYQNVNTTELPKESVCVTACSSNEKSSSKIYQLVAGNTPPHFQHGVREIIENYREQFVVNDEPTGYTEVLPFEINTGNARPISQRPYRLPIAYEEEVRRQLQCMLEQGIISRSKSPWASPMVVVKKKNGDLRLCVDYRKINKITVEDSFPLPSIEELLLKVRRSKFFTVLDLKSGYHQVMVSPEDREKTAFAIADALYQYNTLPFGLRNAPGHFSRLMNSILAPILNSSVLVYLDDIVVLGETVEEHIQNLIKVLEILKQHNLKINLRKCSFMQQEVEFLGHIVSSQGIRPVHDKVASIRDFAIPKNSKQVSGFLGLCGYYRKFIKSYADISRPLDKLRNTENFVWSPECQVAFDKLRNILSSDDILVYPRFDRPFCVTADASSVAIGGVVSQIDEEDRDRPISFCSRALKNAEINYSATDREALAIKYTLERHKYFLLGHRIKIKSDHKPLKYIFEKSDLSSRHARWLDIVLQYDIINFDYIKGSSNKVADALSRSTPVVAVLTRAQARAQVQDIHNKQLESVAQGQQQERQNLASSSLTESLTNLPNPLANPSSTLANPCSNHIENVSVDDCNTPTMDVCVQDGIPVKGVKMEWDVLQLIQSQDSDPLWSRVKRSLKDPAYPFPAEIRMPKEKFMIEDNVLYIASNGQDKTTTVIRTVLTCEFAKLALELLHCCPIMGHLGVARTLKRAKANFYWPGMDKDIQNYVHNCPLCIRFKGHRIIVPPARQWPIAQEKFFRVHMDLIGPLPMSQCGNKYICVITDALTRYTVTDAIPNKTALAVAKSFIKFVNTFGCPRQLISDQGREFNNELLSEVNKMYQISHSQVAAYRPSANGLVESKNKQIMSILKLLVADSPLDWPNMLQIATTALNTAYNRAIGDNPHFLVYGQDIRYPFNTFLYDGKKPFYNIESYRDYLMETTHKTFKFVKHMLKDATDMNKRTYNIKFSTRESNFKVGDRVYVKRQQAQSKLDSKFVGPFRVMQINEDKVYLKNLFNNKVSIVHMSHVIVVPEDSIHSVTNTEVTPSVYPDEPYTLPDIPENEPDDLPDLSE